MELVQQLTQSLGIQEEQAKGGAGLLFKMAHEKLGAEKFAQVSEAVPGMSEMLAAAPEAGGGVAGALGGMAGGLGGMAGGLGGKAAGLAGLAGGFTQLGLNPASIQKFVPIVLNFVQNKGGDNVRNILAGVLSQ